MADHLHYALLGVFDILHSDVSVSGGQFYEKLFFVDLFLFNAAESATILKIFFTWHFIGDSQNNMFY